MSKIASDSKRQPMRKSLETISNLQEKLKKHANSMMDVKAELKAEKAKSKSLTKAIEDSTKGHAGTLKQVRAEVKAEKRKSSEIKKGDPCVCKAKWSDIGYHSDCEDIVGCPMTPCGSVSGKPWCKTEGVCNDRTWKDCNPAIDNPSNSPTTDAQTSPPKNCVDHPGRTRCGPGTRWCSGWDMRRYIAYEGYVGAGAFNEGAIPSKFDAHDHVIMPRLSDTN